MAACSANWHATNYHATSSSSYAASYYGSSSSSSYAASYYDAHDAATYYATKHAHSGLYATANANSSHDPSRFCCAAATNLPTNTTSCTSGCKG